MQDVEITIQEGKLYMLQTRTGKRTARAAVKVAADMVKEGAVVIDVGINRIELFDEIPGFADRNFISLKEHLAAPD